MIDGLSTSPCASSNTKPCICPVTPIPEMSPPLAPAFVIHSRIAEQAARHQSRGSCSAQPTLDDDIGGGAPRAPPPTPPPSPPTPPPAPPRPPPHPRKLAGQRLGLFRPKLLLA